jgi:hypothetical protein
MAAYDRFLREAPAMRLPAAKLEARPTHLH